MSRFRTTSRSLRQPPKWLGGKGEKDKEKEKPLVPPLPALVIDDVGAVVTHTGSPVAPPIRRVDTMPMDWKSKEHERSPEKETLPSTIASPTIPREPSPLGKKVREKERKRDKEREKAEKAEREKVEKAEKEREKAESKDNGKEKTGQKRGLHHHRPSFLGLRKKAQTALGAGE